MPENNKTLLRDFLEECLNKGNYDAVERFVSPRFVDHLFPGYDGIDGVKRAFKEFRAAFPDLHDTLEDVIAEDDKVVVRYRMRGTHRGEFMGMPATNRVVTWTGINIARVADGKFVERWGAFDYRGLMEQLGGTK